MDTIGNLIETYGLVVVAVLVGLESICLPAPGDDPTSAFAGKADTRFLDRRDWMSLS